MYRNHKGYRDSLHLYVQGDAHRIQILCTECNIDNLRASRLDDAALLVGRVDSNSFRLLILWDDLILGLEVTLIHNFDSSSFGVPKEALLVLKVV